MEPRKISLLRYGLLGTIALFSLVVLAISGHLISTIPTGQGFIVPDFLGLDLAIGLLTLIVIGVSIGVDFFRKGAFTSMVAVELGWSFLFTVFWIACSGSTTATRAGIVCDSFSNAVNSVCHEAQALIAFAWLNWIMISSWFGLLLTLTLVSYNRGNTSVWTSPVVGTDFYAFKQGVQPQYTGVSPQQYGAPQQQYGEAPMQQQYAGTPVQSQYTGTPVQNQYTGSSIPSQPTSYPPGAAQV